METHEGSVKPSSIEKDVYEGELFAQRVVDIPSNMKKRADPSFDAPLYVGFASKGIPEGGVLQRDGSMGGWLLWKMTGDTAIDIAYGNWTDRATYTYD
jgi:hypothetical protein